MKFEFQPTAYYARDMMDGDKLVEHTVPLSDHQSLIESVDVGFMDSGRARLNRARSSRSRSPGARLRSRRVQGHHQRHAQRQTVGTPTTLKFQGENEVVDRRAMVFSAATRRRRTIRRRSTATRAATSRPQTPAPRRTTPAAATIRKKDDAQQPTMPSPLRATAPRAATTRLPRPSKASRAVAAASSPRRARKRQRGGLLALAGVGTLLARRRR